VSSVAFVRPFLGDVEIGAQLPSLEVDVTATLVVLGALASRDWRPMHHDHAFAVERQGVRDIFLNTPTQAAWFERFVTDWSGPFGRLGRMTFRMREPVFAGDRMTMRGEVQAVTVDDSGCGWVELALTMSVGDQLCTTCTARVALPRDEHDNPWQRRADRWQP
jgi:acyl dehydratase